MRLLFVVGSPRSGTTLLQRELCARTGFRTLPETHFFSILLPSLGVGTGPDRTISRSDHDRIRAVSDREVRIQFPEYREGRTAKCLFLDLLSENIDALVDADVVIEKTPNHGRFIDDIVSFFPDAGVIHIIRHPLDCVSSMWDILRSEQDSGRFPRKTPLRTICRCWRENVFGVLGKAWRTDMVHVRYEDMVSVPDDVFLRLRRWVENQGLRLAPCQSRTDRLFDPAWEPWKAGVLEGRYLDRSQLWQDRLSSFEAMFVEDYLQREIKYLGYRRRTSPSSVSRLRMLVYRLWRRVMETRRQGSTSRSPAEGS